MGSPPVDDGELARLCHENMVEVISRFAREVDAALVERRDGVVIISTGLPILTFNQVLVDDEGAAAETLPVAIESLRARRAPFVVNLRVGRDDRWIPAVASLGLVPISPEPWLPAMAMHPVASAGAAPEDLDIRRVTDGPGLDDHIRVASEAFDIPEVVVRSVVTRRVATAPEVGVYVGYSDGKPVSAGIGIRTGRAIGLYSITTLEAARGRGFGTAISLRIAADGAAAGCDVAVLQSSPMGVPIYRRLGYRTVQEYAGYVDASGTTGPTSG